MSFSSSPSTVQKVNRGSQKPTKAVTENVEAKRPAEARQESDDVVGKTECTDSGGPCILDTRDILQNEKVTEKMKDEKAETEQQVAGICGAQGEETERQDVEVRQARMFGDRDRMSAIEDEFRHFRQSSSPPNLDEKSLEPQEANAVVHVTSTEVLSQQELQALLSQKTVHSVSSIQEKRVLNEQTANQMVNSKITLHSLKINSEVDLVDASDDVQDMDVPNANRNENKGRAQKAVGGSQKLASRHGQWCAWSKCCSGAGL